MRPRREIEKKRQFNNWQKGCESWHSKGSYDKPHTAWADAFSVLFFAVLIRFRKAAQKKKWTVINKKRGSRARTILSQTAGWRCDVYDHSSATRARRRKTTFLATTRATFPQYYRFFCDRPLRSSMEQNPTVGKSRGQGTAHIKKNSNHSIQSTWNSPGSDYAPPRSVSLTSRNITRTVTLAGQSITKSYTSRSASYTEVTLEACLQNCLLPGRKPVSTFLLSIPFHHLLPYPQRKVSLTFNQSIPYTKVALTGQYLALKWY